MSEKTKKCNCGCHEHEEEECTCHDECVCGCEDVIVELTMDDGRVFKFYLVGTIVYKVKIYSDDIHLSVVDGIDLGA